ncbi:nuclease domain-containing protein [Caballeronia sp. TF1N1]|uniref:nuclease domain-containing protein n=1 Tax=Caballeronia sp. TF1N1 TaxID=2878153 RepID=UPI001FD03E5A|nr:nuclease domain-containing protein [Caballeronia sp. TF1N1]
MKRSSIQRKTPMKRPAWPLADRATALRRSAIKKRSRKPKAGDDKRMRDACRGEPCFMRLPGICKSHPDTTVPAHRNEGKGMGLKTPDVYTVPACPACHFEYDQGKRFEREHKRGFWNGAYERWNPVRAAKLGMKKDEAA